MKLNQLEMRLNMLAVQLDSNILRSLHESADFGKRSILRKISTIKDPFRIRASGQYGAKRNWVVEKDSDGATIYPTTEHAIFVERGRRPGAMPPYKAIRNWAIKKRLDIESGVGGQDPARTVRIVNLIRKKIARHGTKARWPVRKSMVNINRRVNRGIKKALSDTAKGFSRNV